MYKLTKGTKKWRMDGKVGRHLTRLIHSVIGVLLLQE